MCFDLHLFFLKISYVRVWQTFILYYIEESSCTNTVASLNMHYGRGFLLVPKSLIDKHQVYCGAEQEPYMVSWLVHVIIDQVSVCR